MAIDGQHELSENYKTLLLFLPENEYHELGLLYLNYLIRKTKNKVIYLGQNVPFQNLKNVFEIHQVDYLLTSIASHLPEEAVSEFINELSKLYGDKQIIIGGNCFQEVEKTLPKNFMYFNTLGEFADFIRNL